MTQLEKEMIMKLINQEYGMRAKTGTAMDMAGAALGFVDDATTPAAKRMQSFLVDNISKMDPNYPEMKGPVVTNKGKLLNTLRSANSLNALKVLSGLGAVGGAIGAADVIAGNDSIGNKLMDAAAMTAGGVIGAAGGPVGIAGGAGTGKMISDTVQSLFGGGKSAERIRLEEALAELQRGGY